MARFTPLQNPEMFAEMTFTKVQSSRQNNKSQRPAAFDYFIAKM
jgi:hypothetical protein